MAEAPFRKVIVLHLGHQFCRIKKLSTETPSSYMCFDLLVDDQGRPLTNLPLSQLSQASRDRHQADKWMHELGRLGLDGIIAKRRGWMNSHEQMLEGKALTRSALSFRQTYGNGQSEKDSHG